MQDQFEALRTEFRSEVELLAKIDHRNLVKLLGYVEKGNERLIITEFVPNGTLREHLDGNYAFKLTNKISWPPGRHLWFSISRFFCQVLRGRYWISISDSRFPLMLLMA